MQCELVTAPTSLPVDASAFRRHAFEVYEQDKEDDVFIDALLASATAHVETITSRKLVSQTWRGYLDAWPACGSPVTLPFGRVTSIIRFNWMGEDAVDHTMEIGVDYHASLKGYWPCVVPVASWPSNPLFAVDPIRVEFVAGFGSPAEVPADICRAILQLAAHWYKNREIVRVGNMVSTLPTVFDALIAPWRIRGV